MNEEVSAGIEIVRCSGGVYTWTIELLFGNHQRQDYRVVADWRYGSVASAKAAARRWCKKLNLGIEYVEVEE